MNPSTTPPSTPDAVLAGAAEGADTPDALALLGTLFALSGLTLIISHSTQITPVGTTEVHASRLWMKALTIDRRATITSPENSIRWIRPVCPSRKSMRRTIAERSATTRPPVISQAEKLAHCMSEVE